MFCTDSVMQNSQDTYLYENVSKKRWGGVPRLSHSIAYRCKSLLQQYEDAEIFYGHKNCFKTIF